MGCSSCGTGANGKPAGCKSNGGCSSGGCNRMNVFDWLSTIPLQDGRLPYAIVEVTFNKGSRKDYYRNINSFTLYQGDWIVVEGLGGIDVGQVNLTGELVKFQLKKYNIPDDTDFKKIIRLANDEDLELFHANKAREFEMMVRSRSIAKQLNLEMKIGEVEIQADGKKATFFYTAEGRVDFRGLIKIYASEFKVKIEMKQIGARQESGKVGGIGSCGRELCCSTWLSDFKSVNTAAARYQNLSINQTKLSGQCGRLKCCLNYELDTYMDALREFPDKADKLDTDKGIAFLQKRDIFKNLMWYSLPGSNKTYPLSIERVNTILAANQKGEKSEFLPEELEVVTSGRGIKVKEDIGFVNDVGQESLRSLEKKSKHKNKKKTESATNKPQQAKGPVSPKPQHKNVDKTDRSDKVNLDKSKPTSKTQQKPQNRPNKPQQELGKQEDKRTSPRAEAKEGTPKEMTNSQNPPVERQDRPKSDRPKHHKGGQRKHKPNPNNTQNNQPPTNTGGQ